MQAGRHRPRTLLAVFFILGPALFMVVPIAFMGTSEWIHSDLQVLLERAFPFVTLAGVALGMGALTIPLAGMAAHVEVLLRTGRPARGVILRVEETGLRINKKPMVRLFLRVERVRGDTYEAVAERLISFMEVPLFQPGQALRLRVNPLEPTDVVIEGPLPR